MNRTPVPTTESVESLLGQAADEYFDEAQRGRQPKVEEYARRYPDIAELIREVFPKMNLINQSVGSGQIQNEPEAGQPKQLGDFRILRQIGRGGMGVVYEAEQISVGRNVALKVLPFASLADEKPLLRFKNEIRAAASLNHPNIVSVFSVGEERGIHYYAMQLIQGQSLSEVIEQLRELRDGQEVLDGGSISQAMRGPSSGSLSADEPTLDVSPSSAPPASAVETKAQAVTSTVPQTTRRAFYRSIAQLGVQAGEALHAAHEQGVVHRDVKPANLLLDASSKLWVTDFGLARIEADAGVTMTGDIVGTLRYMSPEQALAKRIVVDNRTDIYSLGATIYEALALQPAFAGQDRQELLRQIAFEEPVALRKVDRSIPVELETIVHKCLAKNPDERYASAQEVANDLQRFLDERSILARPPSLRNRLSKWSRRNRALVRTGMLAFALCVTTLIVSNIVVLRQKHAADLAKDNERTQRQTAEHERDAARKARNEATQAHKQTEDALQFLGNVFRSSDPNRDGSTLTVVELLDRAAERLESSFEDEPGRKAQLLVTVAETYAGLELHDKAIPLQESALDLMQKENGERDPDTIRFMRVLVDMYHHAKFNRTARQRAVDLQLKVLELTREVFGKEDPKTIDATQSLAVFYWRNKEFPISLSLLEDVHRQRLERLGPDHADVLRSAANLGVNYMYSGRVEEALPLLEKAFAGMEKLPKSRWVGYQLLRCYFRAGEEQKRARLQKRMINEMNQSTVDAQLLFDRNEVAIIVTASDRDTALRLQEQNIEQAETLLGKSDQRTLYYMLQRAFNVQHLHGLDEAIRALSAILDRDPGYVRALQSRSYKYLLLGKLDETVRDATRALEIQPLGLEMRHRLASVHHIRGQYHDAISENRLLLEQMPQDIWAHFLIAMAYVELEDFEKALESHAVGLKQVGYMGIEHFAWLLCNCPERKYRDYAKGLEIAQRLKANKSWNLNALAAAFYRNNRYAEAIDALEAGLQQKDAESWLKDARNKEIHACMATFHHYFLAMAHWKLAQHHKAREHYAVAQKSSESSLKKLEELSALLPSHVIHRTARDLVLLRDEATQLLRPNR